MQQKDNLQLPPRILMTGDLETKKIQKSCFACNDRSNFTTTCCATMVLFYSSQGLMRLCNIKNPK